MPHFGAPVTVARDGAEDLVAVAQGVFDTSTADEILADCAEAEAVITDWGPPFCDGWEHFRPDPSWPIPEPLSP